MVTMRIKQQDGTIVDVPLGKGADGKSAYQYAQDGDYTGTEEEFMEAMAEIPELSEKIDALPNDATFIDNVAEVVKEKVPFVKTAEQPDFVDSVDEMTDTSKVYVLKSNGMFYSYKAHTVVTPGGTTPNFTNLVESATDTDGSLYGGKGYKEDIRLSSSGGVSGTPQVGSVTTGFMPYIVGSIIRIKGAEFIGAQAKYSGQFFYINFYDADGNFKQYLPAPTLDDYPTVLKPFYDDNGDEALDTSKCKDNSSSSAVNVRNSTQFRITAYGKGANLIVTVDEDITYTTTEGGTTTTYSWEPTGMLYNQPANYENRIIAMENELEVLLNGTF
jgi:hypothetical protein